MQMRFWFYPCFLLLLGGCTTTPFSAPSTPADQQLFVLGMEEVNLQGDVPPAFSSLQETYPESFQETESAKGACEGKDCGADRKHYPDKRIA